MSVKRQFVATAIQPRLMKVAGFASPADGAEVLLVEGVVFDLDGVLVDSGRCWQEAERQAVVTLGGSWTDDPPSQPAGSAPVVANAELARRCGLEGREGEIHLAVQDAAIEVFSRCVQPIPGALEMLQRVLELVPVAIATNAPAAIAWASLRTVGFPTDRIEVVTVDDVLRGKPEPDIYLRASGRIGVDPGHCLGIDDTATGVTAAVAAGMPTLAFEGVDGKDHGAERVPGITGILGNWGQLDVSAIHTTR